MVGLSDDFVFNSSSVQGLPYGFWLRIWKGHGSLRSSSVVPASPSISSFSGSLSWVYGRWNKSELTRVHLRELGAADDVDKFCSGKRDLFVFPSLRSSLASRCSFCVLGSVSDPLVPVSPVTCSGGRVPPVGCRRVGSFPVRQWSHPATGGVAPVLVARRGCEGPPAAALRAHFPAREACRGGVHVGLAIISHSSAHISKKPRVVEVTRQVAEVTRQVQEMGGVGSNPSELGFPLHGYEVPQSIGGPIAPAHCIGYGYSFDRVWRWRGYIE